MRINIGDTCLTREGIKLTITPSNLNPTMIPQFPYRGVRVDQTGGAGVAHYTASGQARYNSEYDIVKIINRYEFDLED